MTPEEILAYLRYKQSCEGQKAVNAMYDSICEVYISRAQLLGGIIWFIEMHGEKG